MMVHVSWPYEVTITVSFNDVTEETVRDYMLQNLGDDFEQWLTSVMAEEVTNALPGVAGVTIEID